MERIQIYRMWPDWKRALVLIGTVLSLGCALRAEEWCSEEIKLALVPSTVQTAITALNFEKQTTGQVYFFDTDAHDLEKIGVIVRVRQGAQNDLTVKIRMPEVNKQVDVSQLRGQFPCEINRTGDGEDTDLSVKRNYRTSRVPEMGADIFRLLSQRQKAILREANAPIDWASVRKVIAIKSTSWETKVQSSFRKLALEFWEWPGGKILEISAKVEPGESELKYAKLQQLIKDKGLPVGVNQGSKTGEVLGSVRRRTSPPQ